MSDFFKKFLLEDTRRLSPSGRYAALAAFGKHPGWDDFIEPTESVTREDLGLETNSLNLAKISFYVNGIGGQIDSGAWEKLESAQQLPSFNHLFVWQRSGQILVGRLWSSSDGKGRKKYPMVVCIHFAGVNLAWALKQALPALDQLERGCQKAVSATDVRALLAGMRAYLREAVQSADGRGEYAHLSPETLNQIVHQPTITREGFVRVLYQMQSQLGSYTNRSTGNSLHPQQLRVPVLGKNPQETFLFWTRFFLTHVDSSFPLLLMLPLNSEWVDVTVGEPGPHEFFCLRASPLAVPLVSEVPYTLDEDFRSRARTFLDGFERGQTSPPDREPLPTVAAGAVASGKPSSRKWFWFLGLVIIAGLAAVLFQKDNLLKWRSMGTANPDPTNSERIVVPPTNSVTASNGIVDALPPQAETNVSAPKPDPAALPTNSPATLPLTNTATIKTNSIQ
jgi:hypothetical protein